MPTVLSLARVQESGLQGTDLSALLEGDHNRAERAILSSASKRSPRHHALTMSGYKLIADERRGVLKLFDIARDPHEQENLAHARKEIAQQAYKRLKDQLEKIREQPNLHAAPVQVSDKERRRLEALGYAEPDKKNPARQ
jgi:hypothetical protein